MDTGFYDPAAETEQTRRFLPQWFQPDVATFVTFRTADSMPAAAVRGWTDEVAAWLRERGVTLPPGATLPDWGAVPPALRADYRKHRNRRWEEYLDAGHGACALRRREPAEVVLASLRHFDGERYDLDCAVVMPNHVHLLARFHDGTTCRAQCASWLRYSAGELNRRLGRAGAFWQGEPFDHLVRSAEQIEYLRKYVAENGARAGLPESDYLFWRREA